MHGVYLHIIPFYRHHVYSPAATISSILMYICKFIFPNIFLAHHISYESGSLYPSHHALLPLLSLSRRCFPSAVLPHPMQYLFSELLQLMFTCIIPKIVVSTMCIQKSFSCDEISRTLYQAQNASSVLLWVF